MQALLNKLKGPSKQPKLYEQLIRSQLPEEAAEVIYLLNNNKHFNYCLGAMYGAMIGDALGAYCQFTKIITKQTLAETMKMPGGGVFKLDPGQITDDSELALDLCAVLTHIQSIDNLHSNIDNIIQRIANKYVQWFRSKPFDIGNTCKEAFRKIAALQQGLDTHQYVDKIREITDEVSVESQSNGSLMRIVPLAVFNSLINSKAKAELVYKEVRLTHCQECVLQSSLEWTKLLEQFMKRGDDSSLKNDVQNFKNRCNQNPYLKQWIKELHTHKPHIQGGWVRKIWIYSIQQVEAILDKKKAFTEQLFIEEIQKVILFGGDTDTNACILGGILGALIGFSRLPLVYLKKLLCLRFTNNSLKPRPNRYEPRQGIRSILKIFRNLGHPEREVKIIKI